MYQRLVFNIGGKHRRDTLEGRPHLVVSCAMLKMDVINGSEGPLLYPEDEISADPEAWNGMPIVVDHPKKGKRFISARKKEVFDTRKVGTLLNTHWDGKLRTECWFDVARTKQVDRRVYRAVLKNKQMEVSTGLGADKEEKAGVYKGTQYDGIARNYKPDHLAVLPDKIGALSVAMGGGLFANMAREPEGTQTVLMRSVRKAIKTLGVKVLGNEMSFSEISRELSDKLSSKYGEPGKYWRGYILDVYPDHVIFSEGDRTLKINYSKKNDIVKLRGDAVQVERIISYQPTVSNSSSDQEPEMATKVKFNKKQHIASLIGNGGWEESDRKFLEGLKDEKLELIAPRNAKKKKAEDEEEEEEVEGEETEEEEEVDEEETPKAKKKTTKPGKKGKEDPPTANELKKKKLTVEEWLDSTDAPATVRKQIGRAIANEAAQRTELVEVIFNNKNNNLKKSVLESMDVDVLAGIAEMIGNDSEQPEEDEDEDDSVFLNGRRPHYLGAAGAGRVNNRRNEDEDEDTVPMRPKAVEFPDPAKKNKTA